MKKLLTTLLILLSLAAFSQTTLTEAVDFHVKTIDGETIYLFPILDDSQQIVVIDFFSTSCGPCQDYADDFQRSYEKFGSNQGNVYFMGINWGNDNTGVHEFDSIFGLTYPTVSGSQGGGNLVYGDYNIMSYPTVIVITPDHQIVEQYVWVPDEDNITEAVVNAGGVIVGVDDPLSERNEVRLFPQPASDVLHISLSDQNTGWVTFELIQLTGKSLLKQTHAGIFDGTRTFQMDVSARPAGIYLLKITDGAGWVVTKKVTVSR